MKQVVAFWAAAAVTVSVTALPALAATATVSPMGWYYPGWEGVFHTSHSLHIPHRAHHSAHGSPHHPGRAQHQVRLTV